MAYWYLLTNQNEALTQRLSFLLMAQRQSLFGSRAEINYDQKSRDKKRLRLLTSALESECLGSTYQY